MVTFVTILFSCFLASHARAVPPAAAGLAELQAALGEGGLEDAQEGPSVPPGRPGWTT